MCSLNPEIAVNLPFHVAHAIDHRVMVNGNTRHPPLSLWLAVAFYSVLGLLGVLWSSFLDAEDTLGTPGGSAELVTAVLLGLGIAALGIVAGKWLERVSPSLRALSDELREAFCDITPVRAAVFALTSAIGEELFFRGAMLPAFGLLASAVIFGFAHGFFQAPYRTWALLAVAMGFIFGAVTLMTGTIIAATVAHATINFVGLLDFVPGGGTSGGGGDSREGKES